jgi:hypothetical protein
MPISFDPGKRIDNSRPKKPDTDAMAFPDAMAGESVYTITGEAMNKAEGCASENIVSGILSNTRQLRFKLLPWPKEDDKELLAVLQYDFPDAGPAMSCPSIGLLVHLIRNATNWSVKERYLLETAHHGSLQGIRLLDLTGEGPDKLVIESDSGGAGTAESDMHIFDLSTGRLDEVLNTPSRMQYMTDDRYTQTLDVNGTRENRGQQFCFSKTTLFEAGKAFQRPQITRPRYKHGDGVNPAEVRERSQRLAPR